MGKSNKKRKPSKRVELCAEDRERIHAHLNAFVCSETWTDSIMSLLDQRDRHGKLLIRYQLDARGRLKTTLPDLLELIVDALIYPPKADDPSLNMKPCYCEQCTRRSRTGVARHIHWPAHYMVREHLSYTCSVNKSAVDPDELEAAEPESELLSDFRRGRFIMPGFAASQMHADPDAWRLDNLDRLPWEEIVRKVIPPPEDPIEKLSMETYYEGWIEAAKKSMRAHRWYRVVGDYTEDKLGRRLSGPKSEKRGLKNIGSIADFLEMGHSLTRVDGFNLPIAAAIAEAVNNYSREPRMRAARINWQFTRTSK